MQGAFVLCTLHPTPRASLHCPAFRNCMRLIVLLAQLVPSSQKTTLLPARPKAPNPALTLQQSPEIMQPTLPQ